MKKEISPGVAAIAVIILVAIVGYFIYAQTGGDGTKNAKDNPMPKSAASEMQKMMGGFKKDGGAK